MAAHVLPHSAKSPLDKLTTERLRKWHAGLVKQLPRLRTKPGASSSTVRFQRDEESVRKRRVSANRCLSQLKAALNHAYADGKVM